MSDVTTPPWPGPSDPALAATIRTLELTITRKLDGLLYGHYEGLTPGNGSEAGESRPYAVGDDVRRIDWNVTARTRELYVRDQIADRDLEAWLVVDASPTMAFGTQAAEKRSVALGAAAAVGFLTARSQNKVGAVIGAGPHRKSYPPQVGRNHLRALLTAVGAPPDVHGQGATDLGALLNDVAGRLSRRGFVCVISDFLAPLPSWKQPLGALAHRHDVLAIEVVDRRELELPAMGMIAMADPATGRSIDVRITGQVRDRYAAAAHAQREQIRRQILGVGAQHLQVRTDHDWLMTLVKYVHRRRRQPVRPAGFGMSA